MLLKNSVFPDNNKIKWQLKATKKLSKLKKLDYLKIKLFQLKQQFLIKMVTLNKSLSLKMMELEHKQLCKV